MPTRSKTIDLANLPSIDEILRNERSRAGRETLGEARATDLARDVVAGLRSETVSGKIRAKNEMLDEALLRFEQRTLVETLSGTRPVINATGVVIHTNLGRAPLSETAKRAMAEASRYCTLEYDLETGVRGPRGRRAEDLIVQLTGAEAALIVNNCAAAAFFVLSAFAAGGEVIISRGEMVEIGGDFRVPDVLLSSGGKLREVGTTNRTRLTDFARAVNKKTRVILRVHPSNYRIVGFTAMPKLSELAALAKTRKVILYEDIGSGALIDLSAIGLTDEPVVARSLAQGVDIVTFSGDKLLGGPQAGIIAGRKALIEKLRKHPLYRALRVDKMTYAGLGATLQAYVQGSALKDVPVLSMLSRSSDQLAKRASEFAKLLKLRLARTRKLKIELVSGASAIGGGAAPAIQPKTTLIALTHSRKTSQAMERDLRFADMPVISRIVNDRVVLDLRTVAASEEEGLINAIENTVRS